MTLALAQPSLAQTGRTLTEKVRGVIVLHWEYPHFVRQDGLKERVFEIDIKDREWRKKHFAPLTPDSILETPSFCVEAEGYEDRARLGPTDRTTFVFTTIKSTRLVEREDQCSSKPDRS